MPCFSLYYVYGKHLKSPSHRSFRALLSYSPEVTFLRLVGKFHDHQEPSLFLSLLYSLMVQCSCPCSIYHVCIPAWRKEEGNAHSPLKKILLGHSSHHFCPSVELRLSGHTLLQVRLGNIVWILGVNSYGCSVKWEGMNRYWTDTPCLPCTAFLLWRNYVPFHLKFGEERESLWRKR